MFAREHCGQSVIRHLVASWRACRSTHRVDRGGGLAAITPPMTSFSTSICGSHGSSGNGGRICGRGSCRRAALGARASLAALRGLLLSCGLQRAVDRPQADAGEFLRQLAQLLQLDGVEVSIHDERQRSPPPLLSPPTASPFARWWRHASSSYMVRPWANECIHGVPSARRMTFALHGP